VVALSAEYSRRVTVSIVFCPICKKEENIKILISYIAEHTDSVQCTVDAILSIQDIHYLGRRSKTPNLKYRKVSFP